VPEAEGGGSVNKGMDNGMFWFVDGYQREMDMARLMTEFEKRMQVE
jgi:hypothetical protein